MKNKFAIILPLKENFSNDNFGSVSLFVNDLNKSSKYRNCSRLSS